VPFYLRTGKRMAEGSSAICVRFKTPPQDLLKRTRQGPPQPNWIMLGIQPDDCMKIEMQVKVPGLDLHTRSLSLDATYRKDSDEDFDAYAGLLLDVLQGDPSLFLRIDEVEAAWRVVDPSSRCGRWSATSSTAIRRAVGGRAAPTVCSIATTSSGGIR